MAREKPQLPPGVTLEGLIHEAESEETLAASQLSKASKAWERVANFMPRSMEREAYGHRDRINRAAIVLDRRGDPLRREEDDDNG